MAVRVLDEAGRTVTGLRKEDFVLTDNGARQTITEFESHVLGEVGVKLVSADEEAAARAPPRVEVAARLIPRTGGEEIPLDVQVVEAKTSKDGREFLILRIGLPRPGPGEYDLEIAAADVASEERGTVRTTLMLK